MLQIIWKPLFSCPIVSEQLNNLNNLFASVVLLGEKSLDGNSGTLHLLTDLFTRLIKMLEFCHKKLKNNPPKESQAFFFGQVTLFSYVACFYIHACILKYSLMMI